MNYTIKGVVIKQVEYKEYDAMITILTKESQLCSFYARGIRKAKSKNSFACSLFSEGEFVLQTKDEKRFQLMTASCLHSYPHLFNHYENLIYGNIICDIVYDISSKEEMELYPLLEQSLKELSIRKDCNLVLSLFLVEVLLRMGIQIVVDECTLCGSKTINCISVYDGGFLCENCRNEHGIFYSEDILKKFRYINKAGFEHLDQLQALGEYPIALIDILYQFLHRYTGLSSKTMRFLDSLKRLDSD